MKIRSIALVSALVALSVNAAVSASSGCGDARETLKQELEASHDEITPAVARALKAAVDACPADAKTTGAEPVVTVPLIGPPGEQPPPPKWNLPGLPANQCGFTEIQTTSQPDAQIVAWRQVAFTTYPTYEKGPADATYTPAADHTIYNGQGEIYGLHAQSDRTGIVFLFGVPIAATSAFALSGCSFFGGALCWARGVATVVVTDFIAIRVEGELNKCN